MLKILNKTRKVSGKMSVPKQIMTTFFALLFGGGMGIVAKFLDLNRLPFSIGLICQTFWAERHRGFLLPCVLPYSANHP